VLETLDIILQAPEVQAIAAETTEEGGKKSANPGAMQNNSSPAKEQNNNSNSSSSPSQTPQVGIVSRANKRTYVRALLKETCGGDADGGISRQTPRADDGGNGGETPREDNHDASDADLPGTPGKMLLELLLKVG
jgi:hypothetical protein